MINKNTKKVLILLLLTLLLIGIASATETNKTLKDKNTASTISEEQTSTVTNINKEIKKQIRENQSTKTARKTININNYQTLHNTLTSNKYQTLTLNINSNIKLTSNTRLNKAITQLTINGKGKTINGQQKYQFLKINENQNIKINNIKIINCQASEGAAIYNDNGKLTISQSTLSNNGNHDTIGGAIFNTGKLTITKSTITSNTAYYAGAIENTNTLTITNSTINNNTAGQSGGAIENSGEVIITKSTIKNNKAFEGGAVYNTNIITITNSTLDNNIADEDGGAIENTRVGNITITQSNLNYNKAHRGGAIDNNFNGILKITKSNLNNNFAGENGGAVYSELYYDNGDLNIIDCKLNNNKAADGGAIYNLNGKLKINKDTFYNNQAKNIGGAICLSYTTQDDTRYCANKIYATFKNSQARRGGAIFIERNGKGIRINSKFIKNQAKTYGGAVYNNGSTAIIKGTFDYNSVNNKYGLVLDKGKDCNITVSPIKYKNSRYGGAIYNKGNKNIINIKSTQKTQIEQLRTKITVKKIATTNKGSTVKVTGNFTNEFGKKLANTKLSLNINGKIYSAKTDNKGVYTLKYKTMKTGVNNITVTYKGNSYYYNTITKTTFKVTG